MRRPGCVAHARRLVLGGELEQFSEGACARVDGRMRVAEVAKPAGHGGYCEIRGLAVGHLVPGERRRNARVRGGTHGIRGAGRSILGVLVVVDEYAMTLFLPPFR